MDNIALYICYVWVNFLNHIFRGPSGSTLVTVLFARPSTQQQIGTDNEGTRKTTFLTDKRLHIAIGLVLYDLVTCSW